MPKFSSCAEAVIAAACVQGASASASHVPSPAISA
jgi:hypothetical protein